MADSTVNCFVARGTTVQRNAFTPTPPTPASGPTQGYFWYDTTDGQVYSWTGAAWAAATAQNIQTLLDGISTTQGVVIYYDGSNWVALTPGTSGQFLKTQGAGANPVWANGGKVVQVVNTQSGAVATGTTLVPFDDTIPQITEGDQYMTRAITPTDAANTLRIDVSAQFSPSVSTWVVMALFQDATVNALAATTAFEGTAGGGITLNLTHYMTAGTTSATTFRMRAGGIFAGTLTFNGNGGGRIFGGVMASSITIWEIAP